MPQHKGYFCGNFVVFWVVRLGIARQQSVISGVRYSESSLLKIADFGWAPTI